MIVDPISLCDGSETRRALPEPLRRQLRLSAADALALTEARDCALKSTGRVEFEDGALEAILRTFCPSPYLPDEDRIETLNALTEMFYHLKNETQDRVSDEDLLARMRECFDEPCRGSVELLADRLGGGFLWRV